MAVQKLGSWVFVPIGDRQIMTLADTNDVRYVGYDAAAFASHEFKVELNPNGTLKSASVGAKGDNGAAAAAAANAASTIAEKVAKAEQDVLQRKLDKVKLEVEKLELQRKLEDLLKGDVKPSDNAPTDNGDS